MSCISFSYTLHPALILVQLPVDFHEPEPTLSNFPEGCSIIYNNHLQLVWRLTENSSLHLSPHHQYLLGKCLYGTFSESSNLLNWTHSTKLKCQNNEQILSSCFTDLPLRPFQSTLLLLDPPEFFYLKSNTFSKKVKSGEKN